MAQLIHASFDPKAPLEGDLPESETTTVDSSYLGAMRLGARMLAAEQALSARIDDLVGEGVLLDVPKLRALVDEIEHNALPAAEAYEALLTQVASQGCPDCECQAGALCPCPCHDAREGARR